MRRSQWLTILCCSLLLALGRWSGFPEAQEQASQRTVQVDASQVRPLYVNFSRVTGTPEEVILDLGLNSNTSGGASATLRSDARIVLNYYTAKRLWAALQLTIERHEKAFGKLELDVRKRLLTPT